MIGETSHEEYSQWLLYIYTHLCISQSSSGDTDQNSATVSNFSDIDRNPMALVRFQQTSKNLVSAAEFRPQSPESCHQLRFALVIFLYKSKAEKYFQRSHFCFFLKNWFRWKYFSTKNILRWNKQSISKSSFRWVRKLFAPSCTPFYEAIFKSRTLWTDLFLSIHLQRRRRGGAGRGHGPPSLFWRKKIYKDKKNLKKNKNKN